MTSSAFEEPYFSTIEVYAQNAVEFENNRIRFDDNLIIMKDLKAFLLLRKQELDSLQTSKFYVKLKYSNKTKKASISLVENILREVDILKVKYYKAEEPYKPF